MPGYEDDLLDMDADADMMVTVDYPTIEQLIRAESEQLNEHQIVSLRRFADLRCLQEEDLQWRGHIELGILHLELKLGDTDIALVFLLDGKVMIQFIAPPSADMLNIVASMCTAARHG